MSGINRLHIKLCPRLVDPSVGQCRRYRVIPISNDVVALEVSGVGDVGSIGGERVEARVLQFARPVGGLVSGEIVVETDGWGHSWVAIGVDLAVVGEAEELGCDGADVRFQFGVFDVLDPREEASEEDEAEDLAPGTLVTGLDRRGRGVVAGEALDGFANDGAAVAVTDEDDVSTLV